MGRDGGRSKTRVWERAPCVSPQMSKRQGKSFRIHLPKRLDVARAFRLRISRISADERRI
jgi:hypothetical protein